MIKYKCLVCGIQWGDPQATEAEVSHGYCPLCIRKRFTERIRQAQVRTGHSDCFNRSYNDCSEVKCSFWTACQDDSVVSWKKRLLGLDDVQEMEPSQRGDGLHNDRDALLRHAVDGGDLAEW